MKSINPYIGFNGKCREAMTFYKDCLGGELELQQMDPVPARQLRGEMEAGILHASLTIDGKQVIMGSDMTDTAGHIPGNNFALTLDCESEAEILDLFNKLGKGGTVTIPLKEEFWGALFGKLTDQFGIQWQLNFDKNNVR